MHMSAITLASESLGDTGGVSTNGPGLFHTNALAISKTIRTSVEPRADQSMPASEGENLRVSPALAGGGPLNTNDTPFSNHDVRESLKVSEELTKERER